jgi:hypothetical protein
MKNSVPQYDGVLPPALNNVFCLFFLWLPTYCKRFKWMCIMFPLYIETFWGHAAVFRAI